MPKKGKKTTNTFKFKSFSERIGNVNIDVHRNEVISSKDIPENDKDTFFRQCLEKWSELNCSLDFTEFYRKVKPYVQTFNQLVYHKKKVFEVLKEYLGKEESLAHEACIQLLTQLSRDLLDEFYAYFDQFFPILTKFLEKNDAKLIENTFVCFAYIFKFLWRWMVKDLRKSFKLFSSLLSSSNKQHIKEFAAEAFAFLIRKSKDKESTIKFLLGKITEDLAEGIGYLFFHSIKGVKKQLNLNGEESLQTILDSTYLVSNDKDQVLKCLKVIWLASLKHLSPENASFLYKSLCGNVTDYCINKKDSWEVLRCYLCLLKETVTFKDGACIDKREVIKVLSNHLDVLCNIDGIKEDMHSLVSVLIMTYKGDLTDAELVDFFNGFVQMSSNTVDLINFFEHFIKWYKFGILKPVIFSYFADNFENANENSNILEFLVKLIYAIDPKGKLCKPLTDKLESDEIIDLQRPKKKPIHQILLKELSLDLWKEKPSLFWTIVTVLTRLRLIPTKHELVLIHSLLNKIVSQNLKDASPHHLFSCASFIQCYYVLKNEDEKDEHPQLSFSLMKHLIQQSPKDTYALQSFEIFARHLKEEKSSEEVTTEEILEALDCIKENLNSPYKLQRLLTLMIFEHFVEDVSETESDKVAFSLCIEAESIETTLDNYRNKLLHLQKLAIRNEDQYSSIIGEAVLRNLIGNLFVNLSVLWEPIVKVIVTFADDKSKYFWKVWVEVLNNTANVCSEYRSRKGKELIGDVESEVYQNYINVFEKERTEQRPDHHNFRRLLWNAMSHFPYVVERRSRDIVPIFFRFIEEEYTINNELCLKTQNVSNNKFESTYDESNQQRPHMKKNNSTKIKSLCAHLEVFTHFRAPRSLSKEKQLFQYYMEFLCSKEHDLQLKALTCLYTYKFPYLKPYAENFEKLMDDTSFREELVKFSSEDESEYKAEHKEKLMPILTRLLYGKLHRKAGLGVGGKTSFSTRRNVIMQFLANCNHKEIETFMNLILDPLQLYKEMDILKDDLVVDITALVPLQRQLSFCNMLSTIMSKLRKLVIPYMPQLLGLLLRIIWTNIWCIQHKTEELSPGMLSRMREIRTSGVLRLIEIFEAIPEFAFEDFIEEIFAAAVWPKLKDLPNEACQSSPALFNLMTCWSKKSRFIPLLCKQNKDGDSLMSTMFQLLQHKSLNNMMEKRIMEITSNLLNATDFEEAEGTGKALRPSHSFTDEELIGIQVVKPYVATLLEYLYSALSAKLAVTKKKIWNIIPQLQLSILATISKFTTDSDLCGKLLAIFFPILRSIKSADVQTNIIQTVENLLFFVDSTSQYLDLVPPLFFVFKSRKPRDVLCSVYKKMCENEEQLNEISEYCVDMNSWDEKYLEEPNYDKRLAAYRKVSSLLANGALKDVECIRPVVYNCFFYVNESTDMSLRDASSSIIEAIVKMVSGREDNIGLFDGVIMKTIVPLVMQGMRLKTEVARHEHIHFLEILIKSFNNDSFNDLRHLTSLDPETDFFQNIRHVQMHRRTRAIHQLTALCKEKKINDKTLYDFILPMIGHVIFENLAKSKDHNLLTGTIEAIGSIVRCFPWSKYANVLKNYLKLLQTEKRNQKTIIRVVVAILNNFDFDLSNVKSNLDGRMEWKARSESKSDAEVKKEEKSNENKKKKDSENKLNTENDEKEEEESDEGEEELNEEQNKNETQDNQHIFTALTKTILPQLHKFFIKKSRVDYYHKLSRNHEEDEEEILKVPVAFALVKLLQHLPKDVLLSNLSGILLRVSQALKSQARDVRDMARDTMKKIASSLGSSYLDLIVKEMKTVLQRGYQLHVLGYSIHAILDCMQSEMKEGDLDGCVTMLMQIVTEELFGQVAEEKTITGITVKLHEAKAKKSNDLIEIIAKYITSGSFALLVGPLKEVLDTTQDHKCRRKVEEAFRRISVGFQHNQGVSPEDTLLFIHGLISNTLPAIFGQYKKGDKEESSDSKKHEVVTEDIYLMPSLPTRAGIVPSVSKFTNEHVLVEFGLQQLYTGLKRSKYLHSNAEHVRMLDPFVAILEQSLTSQHPRVVTLAVRCISILVKFPLPLLKSSIGEITKQIFKIIKKFARAGAGKGDNYEMILSSFKAMTIIIRDYKEFKVTDNQLQVLLTYVEEDVYDSQRQATALPLLKAILSRKLAVSEVESLMKKISEISIRDEDSSTRLQCRQLMLIYMVEYPLGENIKKILDFFTANLTYSEETGRISALEMFASMFNKFPQPIILEYASYFFIPLVMMLINDDSALCRKMAGAAVKLLLMKVDDTTRNELFDIVLKWSKQDKPQLLQISVQIIGMYVEVEAEQINLRLDKIFPIVRQILADGVQADEDVESIESENEDDSEDSKKKTKVTDKCLYNALTCVGKIFAKLPNFITDEKYIYTVNDYMKLITELLLHSHCWVRLSASQIFGLYFGHVSAEQLFEGNSETYFSLDTKSKVKDLCLIFYEQLKDEQINKELADQVTKNLIYITKLVRHMEKTHKEESRVDVDHDDEAEGDHERKAISFKILVTKLCRLTSFEASQEIKNTVKRMCVFRWIAAVSLDGSVEQNLPYLQELLRPLHREISSSHDEESELTKLASDVVELIRSQMDKQLFAEIYSKVQKKAYENRESRKRKLAVEAITDPEKFAKRKQKATLAKREQKKRKLYEKKPVLKFKKIRSQTTE